MNYHNLLNAKRALITGASRGVGRATALLFGKYKMRLGLIARDIEKLNALASEINSTGGEAFAIQCDLSETESVNHAASCFLKRFGTPDFLINNAGIAVRDYWRNIDISTELKITSVNYIAPLLLIRFFLPDMLKQNKGHIININSIASYYAAPYQGAYCASKSALLAYSESLAYELEKTKVNISNICPGPIDTDFLNGKNYEKFRKDAGIVKAEQIAEAILKVIATPEEMIFISPAWKVLALKIAKFKPSFFRRIFELKNLSPGK
ncbi:MAG: Short-chain dehydrogenase/reductase SDR [Candidatus Uhrbacteria bacterium GW2011_GWF2_39_13]|uniref:Short-chain dehydrogenase/reductase SDR n=1 Tax=Candidatus Uhrbacteria bacterium GW2011_GWF2_39_13 TaxID=1618995 RepID=A0A0G0MIJ9_9BACT|nr:MAG: Short-chain dehydrogenase/reductase SDR [Candidatus Uhrbacteria bacterium GW2011_GWF2_39_13]